MRVRTRFDRWKTKLRTPAGGGRRSAPVRHLGRATALATLVAVAGLMVAFRQRHDHLTDRRQQRAEQMLGATVRPTARGRPSMLVVTSLRSGAVAEPLRVGDRIVAIDGRPALTVDALATDLFRSGNDHIELIVERNEARRPAILDISLARMEDPDEPQDPAGR